MFILLVVAFAFLFNATGKYFIVDTVDAQDGGEINSQGIIVMSLGLIMQKYIVSCS